MKNRNRRGGGGVGDVLDLIHLPTSSRDPLGWKVP